MAAKRPNRKHSKIDGLPEDLRAAVEQMLLTGSTYADIVDFLAGQGIGISAASVCRYAKAYQANVEMLSIAQENFRRMSAEMEKYPDLDTTEAIIRLASQNMFNALAAAPEESWQSVKLDKLLKETNGLIRAAAYKKRIEIQNQDSLDNGLDAIRSLAFEAMAKEGPDLYRAVNDYLLAKKREGIDKE